MSSSYSPTHSLPESPHKAVTRLHEAITGFNLATSYKMCEELAESNGNKGNVNVYLGQVPCDFDQGQGDGIFATNKDNSHVLIILEDFWVRTKTRLNYGMLLRMSHSDPATGQADGEATARATVTQCFKVKVKNASDGTPRPGSAYLQCMSVQAISEGGDDGVSPPYSILMPVEDCLNDQRSMEVHLSRDGKTFQFAKATIPIARILKMDCHRTEVYGHSEVRQFSDKCLMVSNRRKIRIGSLRYHVVLGSRDLLLEYSNSLEARLTEHRCQLIKSVESTTDFTSATESKECIVEDLTSSEDDGEGLDHAKEEDQGEEDHGEVEVNDHHHHEDSQSGFGIDQEQEPSYHEFFDDVSVSDKQSTSGLNVPVNPEPVQKNDSEETEKLEANQTEIQDLREENMNLEQQLSSCSLTISKLELELSDLKDEVSFLRGERSHLLNSMDEYDHHIESLENKIQHTQSEGQKDAENYMSKIESLSKESLEVENCNENLERLTRVIHSLTQLPAPTSDRQLVERVEDILEEERKRDGGI